MSALDQPMFAAAAVVVCIVAIMVLNALTTRRAASAGPAGSRTVPLGEGAAGKYAIHEGSVVGQVVKVEGEDLVLRQGATVRVVPRVQAQEKDGEVVLTGAIDWPAAEAKGAEWARSHGDQPLGGA